MYFLLFTIFQLKAALLLFISMPDVIGRPFNLSAYELLAQVFFLFIQIVLELLFKIYKFVVAWFVALDPQTFCATYFWS
jgi:hypothetical protein